MMHMGAYLNHQGYRVMCLLNNFVKNIKMCYKISNTADRDSIERVFDVSFQFPQLHQDNPIIDGLVESSVSIITQQNSREVSLAIWGILPETFEDDWQHFQNVKNTLNVNLAELNADTKYKNAFNNRRCLILVTGFFTYYLHNGNLYPYYVHLESEKPFALAGIYNELEDGFKTCSIITSSASSFIKKIHNSDTSMPVVLDSKSREEWLDQATIDSTIVQLIEAESLLSFRAHPIAKEFHKMGVVYDSVLDPVRYAGIPSSIFSD